MPGPAKSCIQPPGCRCTPEVPDSEPRVNICIGKMQNNTFFTFLPRNPLESLSKILLNLIKNLLKQLNPIYIKFRETEVSTEYTSRKYIIFLLHYYEVKTISLKYTALHILDYKNSEYLGTDRS